VSYSGKLCSSPNLLKETQWRPVRLAKEVEVVKKSGESVVADALNSRNEIRENRAVSPKNW